MGMGRRIPDIVRFQDDGIDVQDVMEDKGILQGLRERTVGFKDTKGTGIIITKGRFACQGTGVDQYIGAFHISSSSSVSLGSLYQRLSSGRAAAANTSS